MKIRKNESVEQGGPGYGPQVAAMHTLPHAANLSSTARGPIQTPDVLLRNTMINEWCYRDDDRYTMKASAYSPFSTLWKNNWRVFHAMDPAAAGPRYGKPEGTPSPARSATPMYERQTPHQTL